MASLYPEAAEGLALTPLPVPVPVPAPGAPAAPVQDPPALASASKRGKNFKPSESAVLASCWLAVSCDPVYGSDQTADSFWQKIAAQYNRSKSSADPVRSQQALQCHWTNVQRCVSKFCGIYNKTLNNLPSGWTEENVFDESLQLYCDAEKKDFKFIEAFKVLRSSPKFGTCQSTEGVIRNRETDEADENPFETPVRPIGSKRAKLKKTSDRDLQRNEIHAAATTMAEEQKINNKLLAEQNRFLQEKNDMKLFQGTPEGEEYFRLLRLEKLAALRERLNRQ